MSIAALFSLSFALGLTGAMSPGPMLTAAVAQAARKGPFSGPLLVLGHSVLELALMFLIALGLGSLLNSKAFFALISFLGGTLLIYMGVAAMRSLKGYSLSIGTDRKNGRELPPIISGVVLSVSNPYWFIWWITVAAGYVMFAKTLGLRALFAFYTGHISSDLAWFTFVSFSVHFGGKYLKAGFLKGVLFVCNFFLILFGLYFLINGVRFF